VTSSGSARPARRNTASLNGSAGAPVVTPTAPATSSALSKRSAASPAKSKQSTKTAKADKPAKAGKADKAASAVKPGKSAKTGSNAKPASNGTAETVLHAVSKEAAAPAPKAGSRTREDKDQPLFQDIRYLGRLLGDVVREQEGDEVFDVVETIRQNAVRFRREDDSSAAQTLDKKLRSLSPEQTVSVVRAFSYFSHLAATASTRWPDRPRRPARLPTRSNG
jgi:phosphoenolpyruvate carboxylase